MKVVIVGGGPAGLYCGLLLKKNRPADDVTVLERNPPDVTYGWGLVFSERTLGGLQHEDAQVASAISDRFILWDALDVRCRGETVRTTGHVFAGISRRDLLRILRTRCEAVGVVLRFRTTVSALADLGGADVIIAADGVNSAIRRELAPAFSPRVEPARTRYAWYAAAAMQAAYTVTVRESDRGLFQAHSYPFDRETSAFIVECAESTWRAAGLDHSGERESLEFCERLFGPELDGRPLMSNRTRWHQFSTLTCEHWAHGNTVLVGDAAHTAHFAIGSGTKLAMEDAAALARALERHDRADDAFAAYEAERRPAVTAFQDAARTSQSHFEYLPHYLNLGPLRFTFHLLTRSGWATYESLRARTPRFIDALNRAFISDSGGAFPTPAPAPMLVPLRLRGLELVNRIVLALEPAGRALDGKPPEIAARHFAGLAMVGAGLVVTEPVAVAKAGRASAETPGLYEDQHEEVWSKIAGAVHGHSRARLGMVFTYAYRSTQPVPPASTAPVDGFAPEEITRMDMDRIRDAHVGAAQRAMAAGIDLLILDGGPDSVVSRLLSAQDNRRRDAYGGSLSNRARFALEVAGAVRAVWRTERPLGMTLTAGGLTLDDAVQVARMLKDNGVDLVHLQPAAPPDHAQTMPRAELIAFADRVRNEAGIAVLASGIASSTDDVNSLLAAGRADLCQLDVGALRI